MNVLRRLVFIVSLLVLPVFSYAQSKPTIDRSYLSVNRKAVLFESEGGNATITVNSGKDWRISKQADSWYTARKQKDKLTLIASPNDNDSKRSDYILISNGSKSVRIDISQKGDESGNGFHSISVDLNELTFDGSGGSKQIKVSCNNTWKLNHSALKVQRFYK